MNLLDVFAWMVIYPTVIRGISENCKVNVTFNKKIAFEDGNQNVIALEFRHATSPNICIEECCKNEICTHVEYILNKKLKHRTDRNCLLAFCSEHKCPFTNSQGAFVYDVTKVVKSEATSTPGNTQNTSKAPEKPISTTATTVGTVSKGKDRTEIYEVTKTFPTTTAKSQISTESDRDALKSTTASNPQKNLTSLPVTTLSSEQHSTHPLLQYKTTLWGKNVNSSPLTTSKWLDVFISRESISSVSTTNKDTLDTAAGSTQKTTNKIDLGEEPFDLNHGLLISFVVFGLLILITTVYIMSSRLSESLRAYRYRNYRKVDYLINDHRWQA